MCDIVIYKKKYIFDFCPCSWHSALEVLVISEMIRVAGASFVSVR